MLKRCTIYYADDHKVMMEDMDATELNLNALDGNGNEKIKAVEFQIEVNDTWIVVGTVHII